MAKIILRFEMSQDIGLGHMSRQLSLADELVLQGIPTNEIVLAIGEATTLGPLLDREPFRVVSAHAETDVTFINRIIQTEAPELILFDQKVTYPAEILTAWRNKTKLVFFDFLGNAGDLRDLIIMPNAHFDPSTCSVPIVSGLSYTILGRQVIRQQGRVGGGTETVVTTGGSDPAGVLIHLLELAKCLPVSHPMVFLKGSAFKHTKQLDEMSEHLPSNLSIEDFSLDRLSHSRRAISTFGVSVYELIYLKIPILLISHSLENDLGAKNLLKFNPELNCRNLGFWKDVTLDQLETEMDRLTEPKPTPDSYLSQLKNGRRNVANLIVKFMSGIN